MAEKKLSRREFIKRGTAGGIGALLFFGSCESGVSFKKAVSDVNLRQQYIDQLVREEPSPYVGRVIYDHDKLKIKEPMNRFYLRHDIETMLKDPRFKNLSPEERELKRDELFRELSKSPDMQNGLKELYENTILRGSLYAKGIVHPYD